MKDTIKVKEGDLIVPGQELAKIGNSGLTPRPHLHLQVSYSGENVWTEEGVPVIFDNMINPIKNKTINIK